MEKISKILPSSPRMQFNELSKSQPARPGSPSMGRVSRELNTSKLSEKFFDNASPIIEDRASFSEKLDEQNVKKQEITEYKDTIENRRNKIAEQIANKFFDLKSKHSAAGKSLLSAVDKDENKSLDNKTNDYEKSNSLDSVVNNLNSEIDLTV